MRRWEFTGETKTVFSVVLRRIKAAVTFTLKCGIEVKAGEPGGWIEKESNLADDAWVCGDARVFGNARVSGDAHYLLIGRIGSRADTTTFTRDKAGTIYVSCGCFYGTIAEFRAKVRETHGDNKHGRVYQAAADLAELQIDTSPIEDEEVNGDD
jgi:hypothetical protein